MIAELEPRRLRYTWDVVTHLVGREFKLRYTRSFVGWLWAIADPFSRLLILSFLFKRILVVDQPNYTVFLFVGIVTWAWFASGRVGDGQCGRSPGPPVPSRRTPGGRAPRRP